MKQLRLAPLAVFAFAVSAMPAHAQSTGGGGGSLTTFINNIANLLTGTLGTSLAILACAILGIGMMYNGIDKRHGGAVILGIAIVFSSAWIVTQVNGGGSGGNF